MRQSVLAFGQKAQSLPEGEAEAKAGGLEGEGEATLLQGGQPSCSSADGSLSKDEMGLQGLQGQQGQQPEKVFGLFERRAKKPRIPEEGMTDDGQVRPLAAVIRCAVLSSRSVLTRRLI